MFKKFHKKPRNSQNFNEYELIAWNLQTLDELIKNFQKTKKSKTSNFYDLQQTLEALYEELEKREDSFKRSNEKGRISLMKDYYEFEKVQLEEGKKLLLFVYIYFT